MSRRLTCIYDAFRFGLWQHNRLYQAGVGRFILSMARELARRPDLRLVLLSPAGLETGVEKFIHADADLHDVEFLRFEGTAGLATRLKPLAVRCANTLLTPRLKTRLKAHLGGSLLAGYHAQRPAMRAGVEALCAQGPTCYFSPYYDLPAWLDGISGLKQAAYVHDIIPLRLPKMHLGDQGYELRMNGFAERADLILTNSHFTRSDFLDWFPAVGQERVVVAPEGCDAHFTPQQADSVLRARRKYGIPDGACYVQSLCTLEERKGVEDVVAAFARCRELGRADDLWLVLSGHKGWGYQRILDTARAHAERILFTGFVDDVDVPALLSGCLCFAYMSRYEGFGLPPLEAMRCGAPVVAANATSLPEVVGGGGLLLEVGNVDRLAAVFSELHANPAKCAALRESGLRQARKFTWTRCADIAVAELRQRIPA